MYSTLTMSATFTTSRKLFCSLVVLVAMQTNSSQAQFVYGAAGSPTPLPAFATGLPVFDYPRPVLPIEFDDSIRWASEKKSDAEQKAKDAREKAKTKEESQRREAEKREAEKQRVEAAEKKATEKKATEKKAAEKERSSASEAAIKQKKEKEAAPQKKAESELRLREPARREQAVDVWDRDLPTERPGKTEDRAPHQDRTAHQDRAPEVPPQAIRKAMEMRELRERLIREHGPDHPGIRPLNAALEEFERRQQGPRPEPPRQAQQGHGPQERGPQEHGPREQGPREQGPRGHVQMGSVDELMHTIERLDRLIERRADEFHAINAKDRDEDEDDDDDGEDGDGEDDDGEDDETNSIRKKIQEMVELRLELRQRVKRFQLQMMRLELDRATMEAELFEQSLEAIQAVTVEDLLQR